MYKILLPVLHRQILSVAGGLVLDLGLCFPPESGGLEDAGTIYHRCGYPLFESQPCKIKGSSKLNAECYNMLTPQQKKDHKSDDKIAFSA